MIGKLSTRSKGGDRNMADMTLKCKDCGSDFTWTEGEQEFYNKKQFSQPVRCQKCRQAKRQQRDSGGYSNDRGDRYDRNRNRY